jgi:hypothetical protein
MRTLSRRVGLGLWRRKRGEMKTSGFSRCVVRFASELNGWGGFNTEGEEVAEARKHRLKDGILVR